MAADSDSSEGGAISQDNYYESDSEQQSSETEGFLPKLWRTAKDDFKLVGDVIKYALTR